jgi:hypothetical protein
MVVKVDEYQTPRACHSAVHKKAIHINLARVSKFNMLKIRIG